MNSTPPIQDIATANATARNDIPWNNRVNWLDCARGLGIILVVLGHSAGGLIASDPEKSSPLLVGLFNFIYSFHMPLFFILSGLFTASRIEKSDTRFIQQNLSRLFYPYFVWGIIQITAILIIGRFANKPLDPTPMLYIQILWLPPSQYWFLYALFMMHALAFVFHRYANYMLMLVASIVALLAVNIIPFPKVITDVFRYWMFYAASIVLAQKILDRTIIQTITWPMLLVLIPAWAAAVSFGVWSGGFESLGNVPAAILGTLIALRISAFDVVANNKFLAALGRRSMPIFLIHVLIVAGFRIFAFNFLHFTNVWAVLLIATTAGLLIPCLLYNWAAKRSYDGILALR